MHFDIPQGYDVDVTMTASTGVQAKVQTDSTEVQAKPQTTSSGTQPPKTKMDEFGGTQTTITKTKDKGNQATEGRSEEIEQLRQANEIEKQALIYQHEQNVERVRQQVMAEGEAEHSRKKEGYKQEFLQQSQINDAEAQRIIYQVKHQAQQEVHQYVGSVVNYAEQAHLNKLREERTKTEQEEKRSKREHMNKLREEKDKADLAKLRAEMAERRAKQAEQIRTYIGHRNERTPDNRAKPKAETGASPTKSPGNLPPVPPMPTGETSPGSQDKPKKE